jgi:hypothetical protein
MSAEQRFTFDEVAALYDRVRPRYPTELLSAVVELAGLAASGRFETLLHRRHEWAKRLATRDYLDLMQTYSGHRMLDEPALAALLVAVAEVIDAGGGSIEIHYDANLYIARRR